MTGRIYPGPKSTGISLFSHGASKVVSFRKWDLDPHLHLRH
ncbi:hypothetical protein [Paenibacillus ehimensis]